MAIVRLRPEELRDAIEKDLLSLQFQPQVHTPTGKLVGAEAFVRWPHPSHGMIGPSDIIRLVELGRFHVEFDRWVFTALADQVRRWKEEDFDVPVVAANIWEHTLRSPDLISTIEKVILAASVRADAIEIEVPRGTVRDKALAEAARRLRVLGVRVASEEFTDLALAPAAEDFDTLKIGYPVVRDIAILGSASADAVRAAVEAGAMARRRVVADSVETADQEAVLLDLGCDIVQGYLYGPEVSAKELRQLTSVAREPQ
jgi:EAL domain-containing protein (putative c-di-GMP-specific phosphodiesterase class I)